MEWLEALILGILQGLTEFLPVSSSGHLELGKALLQIKPSDDLLFSIILHAATALSTVVVFRKEIGFILKGMLKFKWNDEWEFALKVVISMIPVGIVGIFFKKWVESFFEGNIPFVGGMLLITGVLLLITRFKQENLLSTSGQKTILDDEPTPKEVQSQTAALNQNISYLQAFIIGLAQAIAVLPGISRSGATIATALLIGVPRGEAARFSFLMVLAPIFGATLLEVKDFLEQSSVVSLDVSFLSIGFITAFIVGLIACYWMVELVKKRKLIYFAIYCLVVGLIALFV
ncbi:undecaprenyl-diphosphate phosphatase [Bernardetia sp.]|uniref:undecaprenyl-diphosphate phosphatase n=1 Tax=Bernardetia sp. TaxID=1937974 RepID=UPI0025BE9B49|nr:undecaprenyl-diphosphate phosphatase [Bernardetia sp.]